MDFEWDEKKRLVNLSKHGLDFADAAKVFCGPLVTWLDVRFDYGEPRFTAFGMLNSRVVVVAYLETPAAIRVVSMRKAIKREEAYYFENLQN